MDTEDDDEGLSEENARANALARTAKAKPRSGPPISREEIDKGTAAREDEEDEDEGEVAFAGQRAAVTLHTGTEQLLLKSTIKRCIGATGFLQTSIEALSSNPNVYFQPIDRSHSVLRMSQYADNSIGGESLTVRYRMLGETASVIICGVTSDQMLSIARGCIPPWSAMMPLDFVAGTAEAGRKALANETWEPLVAGEISWTYEMATKTLLNFMAVLDATFHLKEEIGLKS